MTVSLSNRIGDDALLAELLEIRRRQQYLFYHWRQLYRMETIYRECIIFSAFIYHADESMSSSFLIRKGAIQFTDFKRRPVPLIVEADDKVS